MSVNIFRFDYFLYQVWSELFRVLAYLVGSPSLPNSGCVDSSPLLFILKINCNVTRVLRLRILHLTIAAHLVWQVCRILPVIMIEKRAIFQEH